MAKKPTSLHWYNVDVHIHTPASGDFQQDNVTYIDLLQRAEQKNLDIIAFADHNTIAGYRTMMDEVEQLTLLEKLNRLLPDERTKLNEYRRLFSKILVLPGFEFTATFGFHIIAVFSPTTPLRDIEHLLLNLNIPSDQLDDGSPTVGATVDVLTCYRLIKLTGGITIAAHANSSNGVAMKGFNFGGQTRIAYTQDANLDALEVTDLELVGNRSSAGFFNGTKPEYSRRMHCIQGSDSHRLFTDPLRKKNLGVGDRSTEFLLPEASFSAILELLSRNDFARTRPYRQQEEAAFDFIQTALEEGSNIIQEFHESVVLKGGKLFNVIADICAFANTNGGTIYTGISADAKIPPVGIQNPDLTIKQLEQEIAKHISPQIHTTCDTHEFRGKKIVRILIPRGDDPPYALDDNKIFIRDEAETGLAVRDEIVGLVLRGHQLKESPLETVPTITNQTITAPLHELPVEPIRAERSGTANPRTGVEIIESEERNGTTYYTMRDLRNGNIVKNVTETSARKLWHYAIKRYIEMMSLGEKLQVHWQGDYGLVKKYQQGKVEIFDLVQKTGGGFRFYFGVTPNGIQGEWKSLTGLEEV